MKDGKKILHNNQTYRYDKFCNRLEVESSNREYVPAILCPKCLTDKFQIGYGDYVCFAYCECGEKIQIYSG